MSTSRGLDLPRGWGSTRSDRSPLCTPASAPPGIGSETSIGSESRGVSKCLEGLKATRCCDDLAAQRVLANRLSCLRLLRQSAHIPIGGRGCAGF
jgi:hypothetical protein